MNQKKKIISKNSLWLWVILVVILIVALISTNLISKEGENDISLTHVHGLGFTNDGTQLIIPAHEGLVSFSEGRWSAVSGKKHDYMGFTLVDNGFYSSGHPEFRSSELKDPLGIVKSTDNGETLEILDLHGVEDFHSMAVGYQTHTIYVINPKPNERMSETGIYVSEDETKTWTRSEALGVAGSVSSIAVHPTDPGTIAIGTSDGVFISSDYGNQFNKLSLEQEVTALAFGKTGDLFMGVQGFLIRQTENSMNTLNASGLSEGVILYIAQNPQNENEIAYATSSKDVFISRDAGLNWIQIADKGRTLTE